MGVSRRHSRIELDADGNYVISDLNSLNGTFVNSARVARTVLADGDKILIGQHAITFENDDAVRVTVDRDEAEHDENATAARTRTTPTPESEDVRLVTAAESAIDERPAEKDNGPAPEPADRDKAAAHPGCPMLIETNKHVVYKLDKPITTLGNSENDDIFVDGMFIDEQHIVIEKRDDGVWLSSKKLLGPIKVNGKKTKLHCLQHKDRIEIGTSTFRYMENE
jgi:pSer/pThr/pTyr-binding forkhead associated (FHA) protein